MQEHEILIFQYIKKIARDGNPAVEFFDMDLWYLLYFHTYFVSKDWYVSSAFLQRKS